MHCDQIQFSRHAIERMFQRAIPPDVLSGIIENGEIIASYRDDRPYPSVLILGFQEVQPVHVVVAKDEDSGVCYVITVYRPAPEVWSDDFKTRRKP